VRVLRVLRKYPWYAVVALLVLAAAIGSSYGAVAHTHASSASNGCNAGASQCLTAPVVALMATDLTPTTTTLTPTTTTLTSTTTTLTTTPTTFTPAPPAPATSSTTSTTSSSTTTTPKPFPHSSVSYPNGAIVTFGSSHYVFAGGRAFTISSSSLLTAMEKVDPAKVLAAPAGTSAPTSTHPRSGVLLTTRPVNGNVEIYVVGTDGELHGFATSDQFVRDGYDPRLVVTVPSLGGLTVGAGAGSTLTALATKADGALVKSSGTFYTFAGGKAFGIGTPALLTQVRKTNGAQTLTGSVTSSEKSAAIASGAVLDVAGKVYVSYQGALYAFRTMTQVASDGYGGTAAVPTPHTGGLTVVSNYTGS
jgi:hypothetical protein